MSGVAGKGWPRVCRNVSLSPVLAPVLIRCSMTNFGDCTFTNAATGKRYRAEENGIVSTLGGGANFLPGNVAGTTASGGKYS